MTHRKRLQPGQKPIERVNAESPLKLTRRDVARRELVKAIEEHFDQGDPVVIHLLAAASRDVSAPVARSAGKRVFEDNIDEVVQDEYRDAFRSLLREPYNFFKHGGADADAQLPFFNPASNDMLILAACGDYEAAFGAKEVEMIIFFAWHAITYPDTLNEGGQQFLPMIEKGFEGLDAQGRLKRAREIIDAVREDPDAFKMKSEQ